MQGGYGESSIIALQDALSYRTCRTMTRKMLHDPQSRGEFEGQSSALPDDEDHESRVNGEEGGGNRS